MEESALTQELAASIRATSDLLFSHTHDLFSEEELYAEGQEEYARQLIDAVCELDPVRLANMVILSGDALAKALEARHA